LADHPAWCNVTMAARSFSSIGRWESSSLPKNEIGEEEEGEGELSAVVVKDSCCNVSVKDWRLLLHSMHSLCLSEAAMRELQSIQCCCPPQVHPPNKTPNKDMVSIGCHVTENYGRIGAILTFPAPEWWILISSAWSELEGGPFPSLVGVNNKLISVGFCVILSGSVLAFDWYMMC
jgi:hypothetical protein